jgi:two-component system LytT family response regulator
VRVSRSTIVNLSRVKEVRFHRHGNCTVLLQDGTKLALSRGHRRKLEHWLGGEPQPPQQAGR